jgi:hypothetical protein
MAEEVKKEVSFPLDETQEERTRTTPKPTEGRDKRDRSIELPAEAIDENLADRRDAANHFAGQTTDEHNENEVQGKLAVPYVKVMKRGQTRWTDEDGNVHKELNDAEADAELTEEAVPEYLKLHQEVLEGRDPLEATLDYQSHDPEKVVQEGTLKDAELHPRTRGLGAVV